MQIHFSHFLLTKIFFLLIKRTICGIKWCLKDALYTRCNRNYNCLGERHTCKRKSARASLSRIYWNLPFFFFFFFSPSVCLCVRVCLLRVILTLARRIQVIQTIERHRRECDSRLARHARLGCAAFADLTDATSRRVRNRGGSQRSEGSIAASSARGRCVQCDDLNYLP